MQILRELEEIGLKFNAGVSKPPVEQHIDSVAPIETLPISIEHVLTFANNSIEEETSSYGFRLLASCQRGRRHLL